MDRNQYEIYREKKPHTSPDFPYNTYLCSIPLDFHFVPTHWHPEVEIIVIKKGAGIIHVNLTSYDVKAGDMILVLPGQLHSIGSHNPTHMEYENIIFDTSLLRSSKEDLCNKKYFNPLFNGRMNIPTLINYELPYYLEVYNCINRIDDLCDKKPFGYHLGIKSYLYQISFILFNNTTKVKKPRQTSKSLDKVKTILSYIQKNYSCPISVEEIAQECYYSKSHFMKFFKETMGMSFTQYLNDYRLNIAGQTLRSTTDNISDIAQNTGFENLSYFTRMFKKKYGMTPGEYRKSSD